LKEGQIGQVRVGRGGVGKFDKSQGALHLQLAMHRCKATSLLERKQIRILRKLA
jgi:hypothetical protein